MTSRQIGPFLVALASVIGVGCGDSGSTPPDDGGTGAGQDANGSEDTPPRDAAGPRNDVTNATDGPVASIDGRTDDGGGASDSGVSPPRDASSGQDAGPRPDGSTGQDSAPPTDVGSSSDGSRPGWTLIWSDEFNAASGTGADTTKWNLVNKGDGFGNNELEFYTNRTSNAYHDGNGSLVIKVIKESYMGREYTSARLESNGKFDRLYGRYEARLHLPQGQGIWPAFWMLGNNIGSAGWPTCGEIDIMENIGKEPSIVHGSLHGPGYSGGNPLGQAYTLPSGQKFADAFHVFAIEWELNVVRFYMDDILYGTKTSADTPSGARWVYDHPFYLLLNVAVGGNWPGAPDSTTTFPQTMLADYVRVYSR
jgi:beta-glucanase (GH16 family)